MRNGILNAILVLVNNATKTTNDYIKQQYGVGSKDILDAIGHELQRNAKAAKRQRERREESKEV